MKPTDDKKSYISTSLRETALEGRSLAGAVNSQQRRTRRRSPLRRMFNLLFLASISLNAYFLFFQDPEPPSRLPTAASPADTEIAEPRTLPVKLDVDASPREKLLAVKSKVVPALLPAPLPDTDRGATVLEIKIQNSLTHTLCGVLTRSEGCEHLSAYLNRLLVWFFDVNRNMRNGDTLSVIYEKIPGKERFKVLKFVYESTLLKKKFDANHFIEQEGGYGAFFDKQGREIAKRIAKPFAPILEYSEITSLPGDHRKGPVGHEGTDFKAPVGTPVFASFAGRVKRVNWNTRANGFCIELDHPEQGVKTLYLHLSKVGVQVGDSVKQGQKIGESGNTGRSFAPHLHYEIKDRKNNSIVHNPFEFKTVKSYYRKVAKDKRDEFQKIVLGYESLLRKG